MLFQHIVMYFIENIVRTYIAVRIRDRQLSDLSFIVYPRFIALYTGYYIEDFPSIARLSVAATYSYLPYSDIHYTFQPICNLKKLKTHLPFLSEFHN
jgi:hypothetical protein